MYFCSVKRLLVAYFREVSLSRSELCPRSVGSHFHGGGGGGGTSEIILGLVYDLVRVRWLHVRLPSSRSRYPWRYDGGRRVTATYSLLEYHERFKVSEPGRRWEWKTQYNLHADDKLERGTKWLDQRRTVAECDFDQYLLVLLDTLPDDSVNIREV